MSVTVTDRDNGYRKTLTRVRSLRRGAEVFVGVKDSTREGPSGLTNAQLGAIHEFGLGHVPERSFLRAWVDENEKSWLLRLKTGLLSWAFGGSEAWQRKFGEACVEGIRARIVRGIAPPLEPETVKRKSGYATPLVHTAQLIDAIEYEIRGST